METATCEMYAQTTASLLAVSGDAEERVASGADRDRCKGKADGPCCSSHLHAELVQAGQPSATQAKQMAIERNLLP